MEVYLIIVLEQEVHHSQHHHQEQCCHDATCLHEIRHAITGRLEALELENLMDVAMATVSANTAGSAPE